MVVENQLKSVISYQLSKKYGYRDKDYLKLSKSKQNGLYGYRKSVEFEEKEYTLKLNFLGTHFVMDALGVLAIVHALGGNLSKAISSLEKVEPAGGRGAAISIQLENKVVTLIDDAYNANPSSMKAGLKMLALFDERRVAVMGDMLELGAESPERHLDLLENLTQNGPSKVYAVGTQMKQVFDLLPDDQKGAWAETPEALFSVLVKEIQNGDVIWVKSSHGTGLYRLVEKLKGTK